LNRNKIAMKKKYTTSVADCLQYLDMAGWSELIDTRWRRQVEKDLREEFGDALSEETLAKAVSVVLCPDKELPEEEYEFLDREIDSYKGYLEERKKETGWYQWRAEQEAQVQQINEE